MTRKDFNNILEDYITRGIERRKLDLSYMFDKVLRLNSIRVSIYHHIHADFSAVRIAHHMENHPYIFIFSFDSFKLCKIFSKYYMTRANPLYITIKDEKTFLKDVLNFIINVERKVFIEKYNLR